MSITLQTLSACLADIMVDGVIVINQNGIIQDANEAACKLVGYTKEELIGEPVNMLMSSPHKEKHDDYIQRYLSTGEKRIIGIGREVPVRHKSGNLFPAYLSVGELKQEGEIYFIGIMHDLTQITEAKQRIRELSHRIIEIQEEERSLLAGELHDDLGSSLFLMKMLLQQSLSELENSDLTASEKEQKLHEYLSTCLTSAESVIQKAREISHRLAPPGLKDLGLATALNQLLEKFKQSSGISLHREIDESFPPWNSLQQINVYRIVQESLNNIAKHAKAKQVRVTSEHKNGKFTLKIQDDGVGFHPDQLKGKSGLGLKLMKERGWLAGAQVLIDSKKGKGTTVVLTYEQNT
ncbi:MAG: PAS domain S-box protein [Candidatus Hydrogenedentota bacterium]|nr:MAG: PAS domain S-box protein [Candidatus Hydrogenedentota bacterium]